MEELGDQIERPLDQIDASRINKAMRAAIQAYEDTVFEEVRRAHRDKTP
jgi:hypothetical protein